MPVIDRDEAHFAQASRQMLETGNYFQIRFQEKTRFQKPPGINWLQAASVKLFDQTQKSPIWAYRLPSILAALLSVWFTYFFARRFINPKTAACGAAMLASTLLLVVEAHMAVIDASLLFSVLLMQGALWIIYQAGLDNKKVHWIWPYCFWLAMTAGFVLKGVTPLVGLLSIITLCIVEKSTTLLRELKVFPGLTLFILLNLLWLSLVNQAEHSNYLLQMFNRDLLPKLQGGHESHGKPPLFHLFILPVTFWPASLFLWPAGVYAWKNRHSSIVKFLLAWLLPTWIFFECMPTKLPQYVLPLFPPIALLCALAIEQYKSGTLPGKWLRSLQIAWGLLTLGLGLSFVLMSYVIIRDLSWISLFLLTELIILGSTAVYYVSKGLYEQGLKTLLISASLTFLLTFSVFLPQLTPLWITSTAADLVDKQSISRENPLYVVGFDEPSLVFNLDTYAVKFTDPATALYALKHSSQRYALFEIKALADWSKLPGDLSILARVQGFNYSKGKWVKLILVGKKAKGDKQHATF